MAETWVQPGVKRWVICTWSFPQLLVCKWALVSAHFLNMDVTLCVWLCVLADCCSAVRSGVHQVLGSPCEQLCSSVLSMPRRAADPALLGAAFQVLGGQTGWALAAWVRYNWCSSVLWTPHWSLQIEINQESLGSWMSSGVTGNGVGQQ